MLKKYDKFNDANEQNSNTACEMLIVEQNWKAGIAEILGHLCLDYIQSI